MKKSAAAKQDVSMMQLVAAQEELRQLKKEHGIEEKESGISKLISRYFERKEVQKEVLLKRKTYLLLAVLTGWMGGHRFYAKQYKMAVVYLLFFWSGFPMAMTLIDLLVAIPKPVDENGMISI